MSEKREFTPADYTIDLMGKDYLPVAARVKWFRTVHPMGASRPARCASTWNAPSAKAEAKSMAMRASMPPCAMRKDTCWARARRRKMPPISSISSKKPKPAPSVARWRSSGFGTELDQDLDEGRVVDAPRERPSKPGQPPINRRHASPRMAAQRPPGTDPLAAGYPRMAGTTGATRRVRRPASRLQRAGLSCRERHEHRSHAAQPGQRTETAHYCQRGKNSLKRSNR